MFIKLTNFQDKNEFFLRADLIIKMERAGDNPLITLVHTSMMNQKGPVIFGVFENPQEIADAISRAMSGGPTKLN